MRAVFSCICQLPPIMDALYRQDQDQIDEFGQKNIELETEADTIKQNFRLNMPNTLLVQVGFRGRLPKRVDDMITRVRRSEDNIDSILFRAKHTLFESEKGMEPVSVIFWHQLIDLLGNISDQAENVADRLLLFISK